MSATITARPPKPPHPVTLPFHHFTVDEYHRMIDAGILTTDHKVELLDGWIVDKMLQKPPNRSSVRRAARSLSKVLPEGWFISVQFPITLPNSEPEPDLAIVRGREEDFDDRHPGPEDIGLLLEAAKDSLERDREAKGPIYARNAIPHYWIINLIDETVEVCWSPHNGRQAKYRQTKTCRKGDSIPLILDGKKIADILVRDILP